MPVKSVWVTGATGLVGSHIAQLCRCRGWRVRASVRRESETAFLEALGCEIVRMDLTRPEAVRGAADGCQVAIHAAAQLGRPAPWRAYHAVNVLGTRNVLDECLRAGVSRFVHLSTVAVYGPPAGHSTLPIDETSRTDLPVDESDFYSRSKRMAEALVRDVDPRVLGWTILRPDVVIGERDRHFTPRILRIARRPLLVLAGGGRNDLPLVYAGNLALAAELAVTRECAIARTYNVTDDGQLSQRELFSEASGRTAPHFLPLPMFGLSVVTRMMHVLVPRLLGRPSPLSPDKLWFLANSDPFSDERICRELGWSPAVSTADGWGRSVRWCRRAAGNDRARGMLGE